jgi:cytochrome b involved in lipid metabolism
MGKTFTTSDVASHNKPDNLYIIVDDDVYDLTKFQDEHPGKRSIRLPVSISPFGLS